MNRKGMAQKVSLYGMLIALSFVLSYIEWLIPFSIGIQGVKLGLTNLVTMTGLYTIGIKGTLAISLIRALLVGFTFRNLFAVLYSLGGLFLSMSIMGICKRFRLIGTVGVSILGGIGHNIGQLCVAAYAVKQPGVFYYLPVLLISGTLAGLIIGILGSMLFDRIRAVNT